MRCGSADDAGHVEEQPFLDFQKLRPVGRKDVGEDLDIERRRSQAKNRTRTDSRLTESWS